MIRPPALRLTEAKVLGPKGLEDRDLILRDGRITDDPSETRDVALPGLWLLPGIIDLHGDGFERQLAPRRGASTDIRIGLQAVETEVAAAGITTAWLAQFWSWEGGMRGPDFAKTLAVALQETRGRHRLDLRMQLRFERTMLEDISAATDLVTRYGIDYVVFNDHLPHDHLAAGKTPPRLTGSALKAGRSPEAHHTLMASLAANCDTAPVHVAKMAAHLSRQGVRLGSHDDADAAERTHWAHHGLSISEFPVSQSAAQAANVSAAPVVMGAPNIVRGGSHKRGGLAAHELVDAGFVDALASDYHYPSLAAAALTLVDRGGIDLATAWHLISSGPAAIMGLHDRGNLAPGQRADVIVMCPTQRRVVGTLCQGIPVLALAELAVALA